MAEYIERRALLETVGEMYDFADPRFKRGRDIRREMMAVRKIIENQPTTDVQEVRHGEWIDNAEDVYFGSSFARKHCSECGDEPEYREGKNSYVLSNYCRNCGAKMDKSE